MGSRSIEYLLGFIKELGRLCADKAYLSRKICNLVAKHGGEPYISIKKNVTRIRSQPGVVGMEGDARPVPQEQEALQEEVPSKKPGRDSDIHCEEEVQPHLVFEEEEGAEERAETEGR